MAVGALTASSPPAVGPAGRSQHAAKLLLFVFGTVWLGFQCYIAAVPQPPMVQRPVHLALALACLFLALPLESSRVGHLAAVLTDAVLVGASVACGLYYLLHAPRLSTRIEMIDPVLAVDIFFGVVLLLVLLEAVRRAVGWSLLGLLLFVLFYNFLGNGFPGWSRFRGFGLEETVELLAMTANGVLGITTDTSVQFVYYFVAFGAVFAAIGGGRLFIDIGLAASGRRAGGAAKAAVISSSLMGTISGSAVANVVSVGVFTIPLMRRAGYTPVQAAGIEAISSTGGQLMPPVMGVAAFVLAELLQIDYARVAWAAVIPALAFYFALFVVVDLEARKTGVGNMPADGLSGRLPILPRSHLLIPPALLIYFLVAGRSATFAVNAAILSCVAVSYLRRESRRSLRDWCAAVLEITRQASQVAVPIAAIGMIIAVAVQSNLALRFSTRLIESGAGNIHATLGLIVAGCIVMGMGLPTVAAYIVGAILFVPPLLQLGIAPLPAHFFVMYYCVLSMVTPPVALASFAAAGLARAGAMETGVHAFRLSLVLFLIPLGFVFDARLLGEGPAVWVILAAASLFAATAAWGIALVGYLRAPISRVPRVALALLSVAVIVYPTGSKGWLMALLALAAAAGWAALRRRKRQANAGGDSPGLGTLRD